ncbi:hypothetical protein OAS39_13690 [Pirellulales bacterium]|nr:hypothetical protein [Pirellulales bacterium]
MEGSCVLGDKPVGGFVPISVVQLFLAWCSYDTGVIKLFDLRVWFALHEVKVRRCRMRADRRARYSIAEIMALTEQSRRSVVVASVQRLQETGLVKCRLTSIVFADSVEGVTIDKAEFHERLEKIANRRRRVPVPRTVIKLIAAGGRRVLIATIIGHLFRLLYFRGGQCRADGNCKASWVAEVFRINVRSVKQARKKLIEAGILSVQRMKQWYTNRYGWRGAINLDWKCVDTELRLCWRRES